MYSVAEAVTVHVCVHSCDRFRRDLVEEVVHQHKAYKNNNPAYIWSGSFRDQIPYNEPSNQRQWIPGFKVN